ncbi:MAG: styrene monooxygenase/indole monooxygenase family protein [Sporichthyaceae bacterium]
MTSIGIVGNGVSALHLGLFLRRHDVPVTIYAEKTAEDLAASRLLNSVAHHHPTLERERTLGVHHWDAAEYGYGCHHHYVGGPHPMSFRGEFAAPSSAIDYRLYLPRLMADFEDRGGRVEIGAVGTDDLGRVSAPHDLLVVAAGRGPLGAMFARRAEKSPYDRPQRRLCVGLFRGVAESVPKGVTLGISPGHGEMIEIPMLTFEGRATALLFENIPGGDLELLADLDYTADPQAFEQTVLGTLKEHYPQTYERVDATTFGLCRPEDLLQGALVPHLREDFARLPNGRFAIAIGDAHSLVDPLVGQGANSASYSAWTVGETILEDVGFDELFCRRAARRRADVVESTSDWTNLMIGPPTPHLLGMLIAMAQNKAVCDEFTDNFGAPTKQWSHLATPERTAAYLRTHGLDLGEVLAAAGMPA